MAHEVIVRIYRQDEPFSQKPPYPGLSRLEEVEYRGEPVATWGKSWETFAEAVEWLLEVLEESDWVIIRRSTDRLFFEIYQGG